MPYQLVYGCPAAPQHVMFGAETISQLQLHLFLDKHSRSATTTTDARQGKGTLNTCACFQNALARFEQVIFPVEFAVPVCSVAADW